MTKAATLRLMGVICIAASVFAVVVLIVLALSLGTIPVPLLVPIVLLVAAGIGLIVANRP